MVSVTYRLLMTLNGVCPVQSILIGTIGNSSTVTIQYDPSATNAQKTTAQSTLASFDWSDAATQAYDDSLNPERTALKSQATQAIQDIDTFLALTSPTNAQTLAIVQKLCQDTKAIIKRLVLLS